MRNSRNDDFDLPLGVSGLGPGSLAAHGPTPGDRSFGVDAPGGLQHRASLATIAAASGVVLGVLGLTITQSGGVGWLLMLIAAIGGLALLVRNFELGIVLFIAVCWVGIGTPTVATSGSGGGQRLLFAQVGLFALMAVWMARMFALQQFRLYRAPVYLPMVLHLLVSIWSTINGLMFPDPNVQEFSVKQYAHVNYLELMIRVLSLGGTLMVANTLEKRMLRWAAIAIIVPGAIAFIAFWGILPGVQTSNFMAFPQVITMAILAAFALVGPGKVWARTLAGTVALSICSNLFLGATQWVSGWAAAMVGLGVVVWFARRPLFLIGCVVIACYVVVRADYFYRMVYVDNFYGGREGVGTFENDRLRMLQAGVKYASHFPLGIGLGNYRSYNIYYGRADVWNTTQFSSAHGTYAQTLSETGWPGLITLLLFMAVTIRMLFGYWRVLPPGVTKTYLLGALGATCGIFVAAFNGDYIFPAYHNGGLGSFGATVYTFLLIGVAMAIAKEQSIVWTNTGPVIGDAPAQEPAPSAPVPASNSITVTLPGVKHDHRSIFPGRVPDGFAKPSRPLIHRPLNGSSTANAVATHHGAGSAHAGEQF